MTKQSLRLLVVTCVVVSWAAATELARVRQKGGVHVTSSTLKWVMGMGRRLPPHSVPVVEEDPSTVWCRVKQHSTYTAGALHKGVCTVPFINAVHTFDQDFEVLVSLNGSSRVLRKPWDKYQAPPPNAVAAEHHCLLALFMAEDGTAHAGYLEPRERRAYIVRGTKVVKEESASILVEDEPLRYDLRDIKLDGLRTEVSPDEVELTSVTLLNPGSTHQRIVEPATVTVRHLVYWGRVKGTLAGRNALVISPDGEQRHLVWGDQNELDRAHQLLLEADLPPGTGSNARVLATIRKTEAPYTGKLTSIYADGGRLARTIQGLHMDQRLIELRAVYSPPFYLHNKTELDVPGLSRILYQSTTTTSTTTTTTSTTTTTETPKTKTASFPEKPQSDSLSLGVVTLFSGTVPATAPMQVYFLLSSALLFFLL
ncbi:protein unzipped [Hyalella azteca]|uniref:Protein unzipped n=1 Tax=Hyalella azteca TaxID=294128 RepID=A0A8B7N6W3_HYAAZ|nr:protein unzipped [Hyalella azteca]